MARTAGNYGSKDDDDFGPSGSTRYVTKTVTIVGALDLVIDGQMSTMAFYSQLPSEVKTVLNRAAQVGGGIDFPSLNAFEQKGVIIALRSALSGSAPSPKPTQTAPAKETSSRQPAKTTASRVEATAGRSRRKPWWKLW